MLLQHLRSPVFDRNALERELARLLELDVPLQTDKRIIVAFSGGCDSSVLLHCLSQLKLDRDRSFALAAAHFDHGLQPLSHQWQCQCEQWAEEAGAEWITCRQEIAAKSKQSMEAAARSARYNWLNEISNSADLVLTAHHADDLAETFLMYLLQGKGLAQLGGIAEKRNIVYGSSTQLIRPMLRFSRCTIRAYANRNQLDWIEDPSNEDNCYYRNSIRNQLLPALISCNTLLLDQVAHAARTCNTINKRLMIEARNQLGKIKNQQSRSVFCLLDPLKLTDFSRQDLFTFSALVRCWLHDAGYASPSDKQLSTLLFQIETSHSSEIAIETGQLCLRVFNGCLFAIAILGEVKPDNLVWNSAEIEFRDIKLKVSMPKGIAIQSGNKAHLCWRKGGERVQLPGRTNKSALKKRYQEFGVPPWERDYLPYLMVKSEIVWVQGIGVTESFSNYFDSTENFPQFSLLVD